MYKAHTHDGANVIEDTFNNVSEIQSEARIQIPTFFRSRESMMKFPPKNYKNETFNENIKSINTKDMHPNISFNNIPETPVLEVHCQENESTQIDAQNMLRLLSSDKKSKHRVIELL
jgi:hypothetical protein